MEFGMVRYILQSHPVFLFTTKALGKPSDLVCNSCVNPEGLIDGASRMPASNSRKLDSFG